jgi:hypothetical protein
MVQATKTQTLETGRTVIAQTMNSRRAFLVALLAATWIPAAFFLALGSSDSSTVGFFGLKSIFLFLGTAHVPATFFFYTDRDFSPIVRSHRARYIFVPLVLTISTGLCFMLAPPAIQGIILLAYWAWQAFHYGRQNIGVYAFGSIAETGSAPRRAEKVAIDAGTIIGILGTFKVMGAAVTPALLHPLFDLLYRFGFLAFIAVFVLGIAVYIRYFSETTILKTLLFFTCVSFFFPVFLSTSQNIGFLSYAIAHGLQYMIFISVVAFNSEEGGETRRNAAANAWKVFLFVVVLGLAFWKVGALKQFSFVGGSPVYSSITDFLVGAVLGATMAHFLIDAGAWKLSQTLQRTYMTRRFGFILNHRTGREINRA